MATWKCTVCGYEHEGDAPPESCPVCGVGAELFTGEDGAAAPAAAAEESASAGEARWLCGVCGYVHEGAEPPEACPVCGAGAEVFSREGAEAESDSSAFDGHLVILGAGIAGMSAAAAARKRAPHCRISIINGESAAPYQRINLTRFLAGAVERESLELQPRSWFAEQHIELTQERVEHIDAAARHLRCASGACIDYDRLLLACGAEARRPSLPGADLPAVQCLRSLDDAEQLLADTREGSRLVVIGGGVLGLECAGALASQGRRVTVLERSPHLMSRNLDDGGAARLASYLQGLDIELRFAVNCERIEEEAEALKLSLDDGSTLVADRLLLCLGVGSQTALAAAAGLDCEHGVQVDDRLCTSDPAIFAAGDCCQHRGRCYGLWTVAQYQGGIAGDNAVGGAIDFQGIEPSVQLKVLDLPVCGIGRVQLEASMSDCIDERADAYRRLFFDGKRIVGAVLVGDAGAAAALAKAIDAGLVCPDRSSVDAVLAGLS